MRRIEQEARTRWQLVGAGGRAFSKASSGELRLRESPHLMRWPYSSRSEAFPTAAGIRTSCLALISRCLALFNRSELIVDPHVFFKLIRQQQVRRGGEGQVSLDDVGKRGFGGQKLLAQRARQTQLRFLTTSKFATGRTEPLSDRQRVAATAVVDDSQLRGYTLSDPMARSKKLEGVGARCAANPAAGHWLDWA
jgi:hypothetical protein